MALQRRACRLGLGTKHGRRANIGQRQPAQVHSPNAPADERQVQNENADGLAQGSQPNANACAAATAGGAPRRQHKANNNSTPLRGRQEQEAAHEKKKQGRPRPGPSRRPRRGDNGGAPRPGRPTPTGHSRRNAGGAAFNGFRGGGKHDLL